jgi:hypothetical protein
MSLNDKSPYYIYVPFKDADYKIDTWPGNIERHLNLENIVSSNMMWIPLVHIYVLLANSLMSDKLMSMQASCDPHHHLSTPWEVSMSKWQSL